LDFGDLKRFTPFSKDWGRSRGGAIDRYYIDPFVAAQLAHRFGRFLEFGSSTYRRFVEPGSIDSYDIIDNDPTNEQATIKCDVELLSEYTESRFDVIICTQVLQYTRDPAKAIAQLRDHLNPRSGLLILTVPFIERHNHGLKDRWRFTKDNVRGLMVGFQRTHVVEGGNLFAAVCFLMGLGLNDVPREALNPTDTENYITVMATGELWR
jgi:SAM-dependent methyltransferase